MKTSSHCSSLTNKVRHKAHTKPTLLGPNYSSQKIYFFYVKFSHDFNSGTIYEKLKKKQALTFHLSSKNYFYD